MTLQQQQSALRAPKPSQHYCISGSIVSLGQHWDSISFLLGYCTVFLGKRPIESFQDKIMQILPPIPLPLPHSKNEQIQIKYMVPQMCNVLRRMEKLFSDFF